MIRYLFALALPALAIAPPTARRLSARRRRRDRDPAADTRAPRTGGATAGPQAAARRAVVPGPGRPAAFGAKGLGPAEVRSGADPRGGRPARQDGRSLCHRRPGCLRSGGTALCRARRRGAAQPGERREAVRGAGGVPGTGRHLSTGRSRARQGAQGLDDHGRRLRLDRQSFGAALPTSGQDPDPASAARRRPRLAV